MVAEQHVVIVWLGMPDNDPTEILTGASAARPLALKLADVLELQPASFELPEQTRPSRLLMKEACPQLISHPKEGAVIYQDGNVLPVRSNLKDTVWYLNGKRAVMNKQNIVIPQGGFHRVTAVRDSCRQTFVLEVKKNSL
jgi:penicillin-binding protein 1C